MCVCVCMFVCVRQGLKLCTHSHTNTHSIAGIHHHTCIHIHTFFVIIANDGVLDDISEAEVDVVLLVVGGWGSDLNATLLPLKTPFSLVVCLYLVTAHPLDQPLALANGERLQQTLVYLHVLTKNIT